MNTHQPLLPRDSRRSRTLLACVAAYLIVVAIWFAVTVLKRSVGDYGLLETWIGPQYFADYSHGFVRRGLPGEVLRRLSDRSSFAVLAAMWVLTFAALGGLLLVTARVASRARSAGAANVVIVIALVLVSPISLSEIVLDPGRYDFVGITAVALLSLIVLIPAPRVGLATATVVVAVAVASEELLLVFTAPFVVVLAVRAVGGAAGRRQIARVASLVLLPGVVLAGISAVREPSAGSVAAMLAGAGHPASEIYNSATVLRLSFTDEVRLAYDWSHGLPNTLLSAGVWFVVYAVALLALALLLPKLPALFWHGAAFFALVAAGLGLVGVDDRRWWTLAFVAQLAFVTVLEPGTRTEQLTGWVTAHLPRAERVVPAAALAIALLAYNLPLTTIFVSDVVNRGYWSALNHLWWAPLRWLVGLL